MKKFYIKKEARIPFTQAGYDEIIAERDKLNAERPDAVENLRKAREMGDLSENGYYKASRARLSFIDARLRRVIRLIKLATVVSAVNNGFVQIGSTVKLSINGKEVQYSVVGGYESDPTAKTISHISPVGRAIMGKRVGDSVTVKAPVGDREYHILSVS